METLVQSADKTTIINKSSSTTLISLALIPAGLYSPIFANEIFTMGLFATSGAVTNWLAVYMLFEKIPFLYGSGVIPLRFKEFKAGIRNMMMMQFFTNENIQKFLSGDSNSDHFDLKQIGQLIDHDHFFNKLVETVNESQLGSVLAMFGGTQILEPMRTIFVEKMEQVLIESLEKPEFKKKVQEILANPESKQSVQDQIVQIVENRLNELTPQMVKEIIQKMIRKHLGWLVVWGGVFGALLGLITTFIF